MRADEHEGSLNDTEVKRAHDRMEKRAKQILTADILDLTENPAFLRWFSRYFYPAIFQDYPVNNGSNLAEFMGRRQLILEQNKELDEASAGFPKRVLQAREDLQKDLLAHAEQKEQ